MQWKMIENQEDVDSLNDLFGNFHDCCLKEISFSTGGYVAENYAMNVMSLPVARFLFQRQVRNPSVIELEFNEVIQINIKPAERNQGVDIISTHLYFSDNIFFWSEKDYEYHEDKKNMYTWIAAGSVKWRERDDTLGENKIYMID